MQERQRYGLINNPTPGMVTDNREGSRQTGTPPRARERLVPHTWQSTPAIHRKTKASKTSALENQWGYGWGSRSVRGNLDSPLRGLTRHLEGPETQIWKVPMLQVTEIHLLIWGHWLEERETAEMLTRVLLVTTASTGRWEWMQYPPAALLAQVRAGAMFHWLPGWGRQDHKALPLSKTVSVGKRNILLPPDWGWWLWTVVAFSCCQPKAKGGKLKRHFQWIT